MRLFIPRTYMGWSELRGMRTDTWNLIVAPHPELYNLQRDPGEQHNLISDFPADAERSRRKFGRLPVTRAARKSSPPGPMDAKTLRELKSLGYVSAGTPRHIQLGTAAPDPKDRVDMLKILSQVEDLLSKKNYAQVARIAEQGSAP